MTRLTKEAFLGDQCISVEAGLDLVQGDRLGLAPTSYEHWAGDYVTVHTYNNLTGLVTFNETLLHHHWGAPESTASKYQGVDIRGEVLILSRNIIISGDDVEAWGGQIVTSDAFESDMTLRAGSTILHNVEVFNCSQANTQKAAIRFDGASSSKSSITNSSIHNGHGWGVSILNSANVVLHNNLIFNFKPFGIYTQTVQNITIDSNVIAYIKERDSSLAGKWVVDRRAGIQVCAVLFGVAGAISDVC